MIDEAQFPVVGIGASAGGIPAMEGLFKGIPDKIGMAFVVVTHLSAERESLLHQVLGHYTSMPVSVAEEGTLVRPDHVYVMPAARVLTIKDGVLHLHPVDPLHRERKPIDVFFSALAEDQGEYAVGIILSGGDGDGTLGAKTIKEAGGFIMAQTADGTGPLNSHMPRSAIASGVVDASLPAEAMGSKLLSFGRSFGMLDRLISEVEEDDSDDVRRGREEIYTILRGRSGHDFSGYKTKTFLRRVRRRMQIGQVKSLAEYVELLRSDAGEVSLLFRDLLINVTSFFRDTDAFALLEKVVLPKLFEGKGANDTVRIWVPGCATGEEVYSLGILMCEQLGIHSAAAPKVQIFATDIDEAALAVARSARYPAALLGAVSEERRKRFFTTEGDSYLLSPEVRELCIFSPHSIIKDPPFSRMDLVSCRNLLIYLGSEIQSRVIPIFHYSLKPGGYLFLGSSESVGQYGDLFTTIDKKQRVFQTRDQVTPKAQLSKLVGERFAARSVSVIPPDGAAGVAGQSLRHIVETQVLEQYAPPHVVTTAEGDVVYYSARTGKFLEAPQGTPSRQLLTMARRGLRLDLRAALREAVTSREAAIRSNIAVEGDNERIQLVNISVEPLPERNNAEPLFLVVFHPIGEPRDPSENDGGAVGEDDAAYLERELGETRERLQSTIEEYETALEEVKASNEELVSVNEEAQSTNEELEASKEEMQSLNEELNTINAELSGKIEELDRANGDLKHLFESTEIATVFLDRDLVVRTFTPAASSFFNLRDTDVGRPLTELSSQLDYPELHTHIEQVFEVGEPITHHLARDKRNRYYMVRLIPYRDKAQKKQGVVVTLVDVTSLAEAEEQQKVLISELNHRVKNMLAVVTSITNRTIETSDTKEEFAAALLGRLNAMSRAFGALSRENWRDIALRQLVEQEAGPFDAERVSVIGPDIKLKPKEALSLGMVVHELMTNAAKYGALSKQGGTVRVTWRFVDGLLQLDWSERDGPNVTKPERSGFGLSLIKGEVEYRLGGTAETSFEPSGLQVRVSLPIELLK